MDERIYKLVMSQPIPMRLVRAIERAPDLPANVTPSRLRTAHRYGCSHLNPDELSDKMLRALELISHGYTDAEIAARTHYAPDTVKDRAKALMAVFGARNRTHLAALAVAQGYVDMKQGV